jgi:hypothetical protein
MSRRLARPVTNVALILYRERSKTLFFSWKTQRWRREQIRAPPVHRMPSRGMTSTCRTAGVAR